MSNLHNDFSEKVTSFSRKKLGRKVREHPSPFHGLGLYGQGGTIKIYNCRGYCIHQLLFTHGPQLAPVI
jgi:hypothetical protein